MALLPPHHLPHADAYRAAGWWRAGAAPHYLDRAARAGPQRTAIVDQRGAMSFGELSHDVRRLAAGLVALGLGAGDTVAIQLPNWREFVLFQQAAVRIGAAYLPLLPSLRLGDLEPMLEAAGAAVLVAPGLYRGFDHGPLATELLERLPTLRHAFSVDPAEPTTSLTSLDAFLAEPWEDRFGEAVEAIEVDVDAPRAVLFTSGSESAPKGVVHSLNTLFFGLERQVELFGFSSDEVVLCASPVGHGTGAVNGAEFALMIGAKLVLIEAWSPLGGLELMARERCTLMWGAAAFFSDLVTAAKAVDLDLSAFRLALTAGAPVPRELVASVREALGALLIAAYGQSEGQNIAINRPLDPIERITGSDGRIHDAIAVKLVDADRHPVRPGEAGEIAYRGPNVCLGYLDPTQTAAAFDAEGFIFSGDLGEIDADRYLRVTGRRKDIIIRGGENISPAEVEAVLAGCPKVAAVAVVGYPDRRLGQRACAVVVPATGERPTLQDLTGWMAERRFAKFKYPERLLLVDALPMTASGKVRKAQLRLLAAAELAAEAAP